MGLSLNGHTRPDVRMIVIAPFSIPRLGVVRLLEEMDGIAVVAHSGDSAEGIRMCDEFQPDVVVIDAEFAADEGMKVVDALKSALLPSRVLLLAERAALMQVETALEAGADGYTLKDISVSDLEEAVRRVAAGDTVLHPDVAAAVARRLAANGKQRAATLTPRQREILRMLAMGLENKQIARRLGIGVHTVKTHVSRVLTKLGASSRTEAAVVAMRDRLIS